MASNTSMDFSSADWSDLGVGPMTVNVLSTASAVVTTGSSKPDVKSLDGTIILGAASRDFNTTSHVWVRPAFAASVTIMFTPIATSGGGSSSNQSSAVTSVDGGIASLGGMADQPAGKGSNGSLVAVFKAVRDRILDSTTSWGVTFTNATIAVTGTFWPAKQPVSSVDGDMVTIGSTTDPATASGAATTLVGAVRAIRDKILATWTVAVSGTVSVTGTFWPPTQPVSGTVAVSNQQPTLTTSSALEPPTMADASKVITTVTNIAASATTVVGQQIAPARANRIGIAIQVEKGAVVISERGDTISGDTFGVPEQTLFMQNGSQPFFSPAFASRTAYTARSATAQIVVVTEYLR